MTHDTHVQVAKVTTRHPLHQRMNFLASGIPTCWNLPDPSVGIGPRLKELMTDQNFGSLFLLQIRTWFCQYVSLFENSATFVCTKVETPRDVSKLGPRERYNFNKKTGGLYGLVVLRDGPGVNGILATSH